jgi:hypothetical protein
MNTLDESSDLNAYLAPGERILWEGRGRARLFSAANGGLIFLVIFMAMAVVMFFVFAAVGADGAGRSGDGRMVFIILPLVFLAVGLGVGIPLAIVGRQFANSRYIVTSSAAMIVTERSWMGRQVTIVPLKSMPVLSLVENRDGTGTLTFGQNPMWANTRASGGWWMNSLPAFWNIERPLDVYQLIRRQAAEV